MADLRRVSSRALRAASRRAPLHTLSDDSAAHGRMLVEPLAELFVTSCSTSAFDVAVSLPLSGFKLSCGSRTLTRHEPSARHRP